MTNYLNQLIAQYQPITQYVWLDSAILVGIMLIASVIIDKVDRLILINLLNRLLGKTAPKTLDLLEKHQALA
ncbi:MAG: hypothetical protein ACPG8A_13735, partial [Psychrobium sp.]